MTDKTMAEQVFGRPMRRSTKEVKDTAIIEQFLQKAHVGYLGLIDNEGTYVVPLNFVWLNGNIYFHGSSEGRKTDALANDITICFTVSEEHGIIADPVPAKTGTAFMSVMVFGKAQKVTDLKEATDILQAMLDKYVPGYFPSHLSSKHVEKYRSGLGSPVAVYRLRTERMTAKEDKDDTMIFYKGRKQADDVRKN